MASYFYMAVTADRYELPLYITDTIRDLADNYNISASGVSAAIKNMENGSRRGIKFVRVADDDSIELDA